MPNYNIKFGAMVKARDKDETLGTKIRAGLSFL